MTFWDYDVNDVISVEIHAPSRKKAGQKFRERMGPKGYMVIAVDAI